MKAKRVLFKDIVVGDEGLLKGPFGSDLKKSLYVQISQHLQSLSTRKCFKKTNQRGRII